MNWTELLKGQIAYEYTVADGLLDHVDESNMDWKPDTGTNWMTTGQLCMHITSACGVLIRGFDTGDWGLPEGIDPSDMKPEDMMPPAEKMPTIGSIAEAKQLLQEDKQLALNTIATAGEDNLANKPAPAPWDPTDMPLGQRCLSAVAHLSQHKGQLFYYLKLQGKPVNTSHLWGM